MFGLKIKGQERKNESEKERGQRRINTLRTANLFRQVRRSKFHKSRKEVIQGYGNTAGTGSSLLLQEHLFLCSSRKKVSYNIVILGNRRPDGCRRNADLPWCLDILSGEQAAIDCRIIRKERTTESIRGSLNILGRRNDDLN